MTTTVGVEKRRSPRMPAEWPVRVRLMGRDDDFGGLQSFNVSKNGLGLEFKKPLPRDTVMKLEFAPGEGEAEVHAYAFVAWSTERGQVGLRFFGIAEDDEDRLAALVERFVMSNAKKRTMN
jgi:hypothetical protein